MDINNKDNQNMRICSGMYSVLEDGILWMIAEYSNVLLKFNWITKQLINIYPIPEKVNPLYAHIYFIKKEKHIYIFPYRANNIYIFDTEKEAFEEIILPLSEDERKLGAKFAIVTEYNSVFWMIGYNIKGIFTYNILTKEICRIDIYLLLLEKSGIDINQPVVSTNYYREEEKLYIPIYKKNYILCIDMKRKEYRIFKIGLSKEFELRTITKIDNGFLLTSINDEKIVWSKENGVEEVIAFNNLNNIRREYRHVFWVNEKAYYIALCERRIFFEDKKNDVKEIDFDIPFEVDFPERYTQYETVFVDGNSIYFQMRENGCFYQLDTMNNTVTQIEFIIPKFMREELNNIVFFHNEDMMFKENAVYTLKGYVNKLLNTKKQ